MSKGKILFGLAPTMDPHDRFFNCYPGSILHAISPLVDDIDQGKIALEYSPALFNARNVRETTIDDFLGIIDTEKPSIVAMSSTFDSWHVALKLSKALRQKRPEVVVIHGGPYLDEVLEPWVRRRMPRLDPFESEYGSLIDFAVAGDGEYALRELAKDISKIGKEETMRKILDNGYQNVSGRGIISFKLGDDTHHINFSNPLDLNQIPPVPRHLLPASSMYDFDCFKDSKGFRLETVTMISHRGCKNRCVFCSEGLPYQQRSLEHILAEAKKLKEMGVKAIFFDDSTIQDDDNHMRMFHELHKLGFEMGALTRFDMIQDYSHVAEMRKNGVVYLYVAIEQYDDGVLSGMLKNIHVYQIDRGLDNLMKAGIRVGVSILFGLPYETPESVKRTLDYIRRRVATDDIQYVSMSLFSYHPRTPEGSKNSGSVNHFDFNNGPPNLRYPFLGFEEGSWYHPDFVTEDYARDILVQANEMFVHRLVRNMEMHRGKNG